VVVFFEAGRLGNQLMQYAVLRQAFPGERLCFFGLHALSRAVAVQRAWFLPQRGWAAKPAALAKLLLDALVALRLVGDAHEQREAGHARLARRRGLLPGLWRVRPGHFLHADFEPRIELRTTPLLALRPELLAEARAWLATPPGGHSVFLHLRRGDYLHFPDPAAPAVVDDAWVRAALATLRAAMPGAQLVVCSDELPYARALLAGEPGVRFCERGELGDLAVMAQCDGGVLSPSTYSWWAAWFARQRLAAEGRRGHFIAPRGWVGHRRGTWYPEGFRFDWIDYR
jgi:Glycosyl transferase family 11